MSAESLPPALLPVRAVARRVIPIGARRAALRARDALARALTAPEQLRRQDRLEAVVIRLERQLARALDEAKLQSAADRAAVEDERSERRALAVLLQERARQVADLGRATDRLTASEDRLDAHVSGIETRVGGLDREVGSIRSELELHAQGLAVTGRALMSQVLLLDGLLDSVEAAQDALEALLLQGQMPSTSGWIARTSVPEDILVTVVTATHDRRPQLANAIKSVEEQTYSHHEHIVVDDGSSDDTVAYVETIQDPRMRLLRSPGLGPAAARNLALDIARGSIVTYLDDDNEMHPDWLRSVVWAFSRVDGLEFAYGARFIEDWIGSRGHPSGVMPAVELVPYARHRHERSNFIDANVMAHRRDLDGARFEEGLDGAEDWDLGLRLGLRRAPLALPAVACFYGSMAPSRLSTLAGIQAAIRLIRSRVHTRRPFRLALIAATAHDAAASSIISSDAEEFVRDGADVSLCLLSGQRPDVPPSVHQFTDVREVRSEHRPDLAVLYWCDDVAEQLPRVARTAQPYAVRLFDSMGADPRLDQAIRSSSCIDVIRAERAHKGRGSARRADGSSSLATRLSSALEKYRLENPW